MFQSENPIWYMPCTKGKYQYGICNILKVNINMVYAMYYWKSCP